MPKRKDLKKLIIIGSGPIAIGQAAEFDFSGSQASRALREEGYHTIIINSNPATIQTDMDSADTIYIEPLETNTIARIIEKEKPEGLLPGFGGQTALNLVYQLVRSKCLKKHGVELLGSTYETIEMAENREAFRQLMKSIAEPIPLSLACSNFDDIKLALKQIDYPVLVRPAYTLGGSGSGVANSWNELQEIASAGLRQSPIHQVLIEENLLGWKEFEYEVIRDGNDNCITICSMENVNPMGVHTGESIVVAPVQTLTDRENQLLRSISLKIIRNLKICGGCNIQFAVHPHRWDYRIIEVNPRVSRSSALASKATGYPIARVSAKIAVGMMLDEIPNAVTKNTYAAFEPVMDYVIVKMPRWPFDKFPTVNRRITTQMKSTGEAMAIGSTIEEALMKAIRASEINQCGIEPETIIEHELIRELQQPTDRLIFCIAEALRRGYSINKIADLTMIDRFFISKIANLVDLERKLKARGLENALLAQAKKHGFPDQELERITGIGEKRIRRIRRRAKIRPAYNMVDTCAGEFAAVTPYYYSTYHSRRQASRIRPRNCRRVLIIGSGPIRIGQGIEFDYCCVHAAVSVKDAGHEAIIINSNPETVSTDFDISTRLYFEPLTMEDVRNVIEHEQCDSVILQFGGQTSINLAMPLLHCVKARELDIEFLGTKPCDIHRAEDRRLFSNMLARLKIKHPQYGTGDTYEAVKSIARHIGYPVVVRPSYVLGGRAMEIVYEEEGLAQYIEAAVKVSREHPVLVDKYIMDAIEVDVDALSDERDIYIAGIMEHIEEAGVHSGDSYSVMPPRTLSPGVIERIKKITKQIAHGLRTRGLINIQYAIKDNEVFVLEANPRASRTVPYVSKTIGIPLAKIATRIMLGSSIGSLRKKGVLKDRLSLPFISIKAPVFPFLKLPGVDPILSPEMKSTGEIMAIDRNFGAAYYKAILSDNKFSKEGTVYVTVRDSDKPKVLHIVRRLQALEFSIVATKGTADFLKRRGVRVKTVYRISEHKSPNALDLMRAKKIHLIINTPTQSFRAKRDGYMMRRLAVELNVPFITAITSARAEVEAIEYARHSSLAIRSLADYYHQGGWTYDPR